LAALHFAHPRVIYDLAPPFDDETVERFVAEVKPLVA